MSKSFLIVLAFMLPLRVAGGAPGPTSTAEPHHDAGLAAYASHDYVKAASELELSYQLSPSPETLYAWAQAERLAGDCERASELYQQFLSGQPDPLQAEAARQNLERCKPAAPPVPEPAPVAASEPATVSPGPTPPAPAPTSLPMTASPRRERPAWYRDGWGAALSGSGVVAVGIGIGFYLGASSAQADADNAFTYQEFQQHSDAAHSRRLIGTLSTTLGAALLAGGIVRYVMVARQRSGTELAAVPTRNGFALALAGSF